MMIGRWRLREQVGPTSHIIILETRCAGCLGLGADIRPPTPSSRASHIVHLAFRHVSILWMLFYHFKKENDRTWNRVTRYLSSVTPSSTSPAVPCCLWLYILTSKSFLPQTKSKVKCTNFMRDRSHFHEIEKENKPDPVLPLRCFCI